MVVKLRCLWCSRKIISKLSTTYRLDHVIHCWFLESFQYELIIYLLTYLICIPIGLHRYWGCWRSNFSLGRNKLGSTGKLDGKNEETDVASRLFHSLLPPMIFSICHTTPVIVVLPSSTWYHSSKLTIITQHNQT